MKGTMMGAALLLALCAVTGSARAQDLSLKADQLTFRYQSNLEPWPEFSCKHAKAQIGLFEWTVRCDTDTGTRVYNVHLVLSFYPVTKRGKSAYELLYWVTDWSDTSNPRSHSTTLWIHNTSETDRTRVFEISQGVENDNAGLALEIDLTGKR